MKQSIKDRYNNLPQHTKERVDYFASELVAKDRLIRSLVRRNQYLTERLLELETRVDLQFQIVTGKPIQKASAYNKAPNKEISTNPPYQANALNDEFSKLA